MNQVIIICGCSEEKSEIGRGLVRNGFFFRKRDSKRIQRFRCQRCRRVYSAAATDPCYHQQKRDLNPTIAALLVSGVSQRRAALLIKVNRKTIVRKFRFSGALAKAILAQSNLKKPPSTEIQFDDLETHEHTKLKPLSVTLAVEKYTRRILGYEVSVMPAKGHLARLSRKKYGKRPDLRAHARKKLFATLKNLITEDALIESDQNPHYGPDVKSYFPKATHRAHKGSRGSIVGQGELKKIRFDPLFSLNHSCAMFRANINRLIRRTWCTTKKQERLDLHIALYAVFHNEQIEFKQSQKAS